MNWKNTWHAPLYLFLSSLILHKLLAIYFHHISTSISEIIHHVGANEIMFRKPAKAFIANLPATHL